MKTDTNQYSAHLRILNAFELHNEIYLKLKPTSTQRKGEMMIINNKKTNKKLKNDTWMLSSSLSYKKDLTEHIKWICDKIYPHREYIKHLIEKDIEIDLFCSITMAYDNGGFDLGPEVYEMLSYLKIPIVFSVILLGYES